MKISFIDRIALFILSVVLLCGVNFIQTEGLDFISGAPTGAPREPAYNPIYPVDVDWFSQQIAGNYYFAAAVPNPTSSNTVSPTIGVYQFSPGAVKPTNGAVSFISSAPTNTTITDKFFPFPMSVSWFPRSIAGQYFFTVVGSGSSLLSGTEIIHSNIRVYSFVPDNVVPRNGFVEFSATAPMQNEQFFLAPSAVSWLPYTLGSYYYFSVVGYTTPEEQQLPEVRVYSFDPWSNTVEYVGAAASNLPNSTDLPFGGEGALSVDWINAPVYGNAIFAVGGDSDESIKNREIRVYRFLPVQGKKLQDKIQLIAAAPTVESADRPFAAALAVRWLSVNGLHYLAVGVLEDAQQPSNLKNRSVRLYQFIPNAFDVTKSKLEFVTSLPTCDVCTLLDQQDVFMNAAVSLDWLSKGCNYYLVVGEADISRCGLSFGEGAACLGQGSKFHQRLRLYQFDPAKKKLSFIGGAWPNQDELQNEFNDTLWLSSVDWFPSKISKEFYLLSSLNSVECEGTLSGLSDLIRVYFFRPSCGYNQLTYRVN